MTSLPMPPLEMRALAGPTDEAPFDNPTGDPVFPGYPAERTFDFGCGCGRLARKLAQQRIQPERYLGVDLHRGMIEWCRQNITPVAAQFRFEHHDVFNAGFNPAATERFRPLPAEAKAFSFVIAHSVFTHILQEQVEPYLRELSRILEPDGVFQSTWFTFDRREFPMLQPFQHALYINHVDPTNAAIFDRGWVREIAREAGLTITKVTPPAIRGYHWVIDMQLAGTRVAEVEWPPDTATIGSRPPPVLRAPHLVGTQRPERAGWRKRLSRRRTL